MTGEACAVTRVIYAASSNININIKLVEFVEGANLDRFLVNQCSIPESAPGYSS